MNKMITLKLPKKVKGLILILLCLGSSVASYAASVTFNATVDNTWENPANWTSGLMPSMGDNVTITAGKSAIIAASTTTAVLDYITLNAGSSLTNNGTLNVTDVTASKGGIILTDGTFDNEGTLNLNSSGTGYQSFDLKGTTANQLILNGTVNITSGSNKYAIYGNTGSKTTLSGTGFTIGSSTNAVNYGLLSINTAGTTFTINTGVTLTAYCSSVVSSGTIYFGNTGTITNNGTLNVGLGSVPSASVYAIRGYVGATTSTTANFINGTTGTINVNGPVTYVIALSGDLTTNVATNILNFNNAGTITMTGYNGVSGGNNYSYGLYADAKSTGTYTNTGTITLNPALVPQGTGNNFAMKLGDGTSGGVFNTGTITVNGNSAVGGITSNATGTNLAKINNNAGGVLNLNFGLPAGTKTATDTHVLITNSGTLAGSFTLVANSYVNNAGCTLAPGDNGTAIGLIKLFPSATGTKFPLNGTLKIKVNGTTGPGIDYDQLVCSELDVTAASLTLTTGESYTPASGDMVPFTSSSVSKSGTFVSSSMPSNWSVDYTGAVNDVATYTVGTAIDQALGNNEPAVVYANSGNIYVNLSRAVPTTIDMIDISGRVLKSMKVSTLNNSFNTGGLKGLYLIRIKNDNASKTYKLEL